MSFWNGRRVFITGHTGFKGAWLAFLLSRCGAKVFGYALPPEDERALFSILGLEDLIACEFGDIRDAGALARAIKEAQPEAVFHLAAQALVRTGYAEPVQTYSVNVMGTVNVLQAIRETPSVGAAVIVTSDKCYEPAAGGRAFVEGDRLGGRDPYSNSKACAELVTAAYRDSFFADASPVVITARAGNVIGGGDWSQDRLVPDVVRAHLERRPVTLRFPAAVRPWQHVIDPLNGYLMLGQRALEGDADVAGAWNFGPGADDHLTVREVVSGLQNVLDDRHGIVIEDAPVPYENPALVLDSSKARDKLKWAPRYRAHAAIERTGAWYRALLDREDMVRFTQAQLDEIPA